MVGIKSSFLFWPHGSKRKDRAESRATRINGSDISKPFNLQTSNPIGYPYILNTIRIQEPPRVCHHQRRCDMSIMCVGDEFRHSPLSPHRRSQIPQIPHPPLPPKPPSPHYHVPAPYLPPVGKKLRNANNLKFSRPGITPPSQLREWVPPAGDSLQTDVICYACERLPARGGYGLCVNCAPILKSPDTKSRFTVSDYARASFTGGFEQAILPKTPTTPSFDMVAGLGRMPVYVSGERRRDLGARATSQRAEHTGQYETRYTGDGDWESWVMYQDWPAAGEYGPAQLPPLSEGNSNSGRGKGRGCSQGKMALHSEEVCIYLDSSPPSPRVTSKPQPPLQTTSHRCHPPVVSGTPRSDYRNPVLVPPPSPPLTPTVKAEGHSNYNQHQQPYWKSLQPAGFAAAAPQQSRFMDMFYGPLPSLSQVRLVG